jgi:hypothetical protein
LDARLTTLLSKNITIEKSEEVKTGWCNSRQIWQNLLREPMAKKGLFSNGDDE